MPEDTSKLPLIWVKAGDPTRVGVTERHPAHPDGEVWVAGEKPGQVAETPLVLQFLNTGQLVRTGGPQATPEPPSIAPAETDKPGGGRR